MAGFKENTFGNCMAEDAVLCELFSADFTANRERYRDIPALIAIPKQLSLDCTAV
jgi:hypothetical protein